MTQLPLCAAAPTLAGLVLAWAAEHGPAPWWRLAEAMRAAWPGLEETQLDAVATATGVLVWRDGGYVVDRPRGGEEVST